MQRITFKQYVGVRIRGTEEAELRSENYHLWRAAYLTAQVESGGMYGTVMNYDGTGMTAGIHQAIAVYPRELAHPDGNAEDDQGLLWKLIARIGVGFVHPALIEIIEALFDRGWFIAPDNLLRNRKTGEVVPGPFIRKELTGSADGRMPMSGPGRERAERYVQLFHVAFSDRKTFSPQDRFGMEQMSKRAHRAKINGKTIQEAVYGYKDISVITVGNLGPEMDLAMCFFWSNTVNAPFYALKYLGFCLPILRKEGPETFAKALVWRLGKSMYGRWNEDLKNGRYQRTRKAAMEIWPRELFEGPQAIMPKDIP